MRVMNVLRRLDWTPGERAEMRNAIANTGIKIMTMCLSAHRKFPLGSHTPDLRQQGEEILQKAIEFAGDIGLRVVQVMAYDVFYETSDAETREPTFWKVCNAARCMPGRPE